MSAWYLSQSESNPRGHRARHQYQDISSKCGEPCNSHRGYCRLDPFSHQVSQIAGSIPPVSYPQMFRRQLIQSRLEKSHESEHRSDFCMRPAPPGSSIRAIDQSDLSEDPDSLIKEPDFKIIYNFLIKDKGQNLSK